MIRDSEGARRQDGGGSPRRRATWHPRPARRRGAAAAGGRRCGRRRGGGGAGSGRRPVGGPAVGAGSSRGRRWLGADGRGVAHGWPARGGGRGGGRRRGAREARSAAGRRPATAAGRPGAGSPGRELIRTGRRALGSLLLADPPAPSFTVPLEFGLAPQLQLPLALAVEDPLPAGLDRRVEPGGFAGSPGRRACPDRRGRGAGRRPATAGSASWSKNSPGRPTRPCLSSPQAASSIRPRGSQRSVGLG